MTKNTGFTLIELLISIAIISILLVALFPGVASARRNSINTAASVYARDVMVWATAYLIANPTLNENDLDTSCLAAIYVAEGASTELPGGVTQCEVVIGIAGGFGAKVTTAYGKVYEVGN